MSDQVQREEEIFLGAIELETAEDREDYLAKHCGGDTQLRERVEALLRANASAGAFLNKPPLALRNPPSPTAEKSTVKLRSQGAIEKTGDHIGRYKLLQKIGEGGCGVVYMAEQEEPVRRRVALKIIKVGMDTRQVIARFEAERQALAMMDHRNIARVLDAGATDTGRPFFVMELVRGIRITDYCDQNNLSTQQRLELFKQVCHAIQHAHQKGIIHRDIKPSNILVTLHDGDPIPVIIDFGVAKATEQRLTEKTLFTAFQQFIGTPAYTSPEQAEMSSLDIDTRSDIYSLGVLLYELLTSQTPFDAKTLLEAGLDQMRRTIREKEPVRPSTRLSTMLEADLSTIARQRHAEPLRLIHLLRGDLDWIVMKCLEKDRTRRYETANALAMDIERYLHFEAVLARPPSRLYRFSKLVRRNKGAFAGAAAVAAALIVGLAVSTRLYWMERQAYRRAVLAERNQSRLREDAESARLSEAAQHRQSEENARQFRLNSYAADVYSAFLALRSENLGQAMDLLERQVPKPREEDLRGFEWRYLWQQARGDEVLSLPHPALVSCAVFSSDGQRLASASYDGLVRIWDLASRQVVRTLTGFETQFGWRYISFSPDGKWFAGVRDKTLTIWDCEADDFPVRFEIAGVRVIAFTPDGSRVVGWGDQGQLVVIETSNWQVNKVMTRLKPQSYPCLAVDHGGTVVALAHEGEAAVEVLELELHSPSKFFPIPSVSGNAFVALAWSPDGRLAATTWSGELLLLDARNGQQLALTRAHAGSIFGLVFSSDAKTLITAGHDQLIHLWKVPSPDAERPLTLEKIATLHGHRDEIWSLAFSPDLRFLSTAGKDGTVKLWTPAPRAAPTFLNDWYAGEFTADGQTFVTLSESSSESTNGIALDFWDVDNPGVRSVKTLPIANAGEVRQAISPDAKFLGVARKDGSVELWSIEAGKRLMEARIQDLPPTALAFSERSRILAIGTAQGTVELWNLTSRQMTPLGKPGSPRISSLRFAPGNHWLLVGSERKPMEAVWDLKTGGQIPLPISPYDPFVLSPDGKTLAAPSSNYVVKLWDFPSLRERAALKGHRWTIESLSFSPDGQTLATASIDAMARLWDVSTGLERTRPLRGHLQGVIDVTFSPDGKTLLTHSTDDSLKLWHVSTGRELLNLTAAAKPRFSPDGNTLLLKLAKGTRLFHVPPLAAIDPPPAEGFVEQQKP